MAELQLGKRDPCLPSIIFKSSLNLTLFFRLLPLLLLPQFVFAQLTISIEKDVELTEIEGKIRLFEKGTNKEYNFVLPKSNRFEIPEITKAGNYLLVVETDCCPLFVENFYFPTKNIIYVALKQSEIELKEVVIKQSNVFSKKGDTLVINPALTATHAVDNSEEIFNSVAGLHKNSLGMYTVFGKSVDVVTVDGKKIFSGNPQMVLQNFRLDMIDKIEFVSPRNNASKNTLNIKLKAHKKNVLYGNIDASTNLDSLWGGASKVNFLRNTFFLSGTMNSNNYNQEVKEESVLQFSNSLISSQRTHSASELFNEKPISLLPASETQQSSPTIPFYGKRQELNKDVGLSFNKKTLEMNIHYLNNDLESRQIVASAMKVLTLKNAFTKEEKDSFQSRNKTSSFVIDIDKQFKHKVFFKSLNTLNTNQIDTRSEAVTNLSFDENEIQKKNAQTQQNSKLGSFVNVYKMYRNLGIKTTLTFVHEREVEMLNSLTVFTSENRNTINYGYNQFGTKWGFEATQAFPIINQLSYEGKVVIKNDIERFINFPLVKTTDWMRLNNTEREVAHSVFWLKKRISGIATFHYLSQNRAIDIQGFKDKTVNFWGVKEFIVSYSVTNDNKISFEYGNHWLAPRFDEIVSRNDSTKIGELVIGNSDLRNFRSREFVIQYTTSSSEIASITTQIGHEFIKNAVIENYSTTSDVLQSIAINSDKNTQRNFLNCQIQFLKKNSKYNFTLANSISNSLGYVLVSEIYEPLKTNHSLTTLTAKYQPHKYINFELDATNTYFRNKGDVSFSQNSLTTKFFYKKPNFFDFQAQLVFLNQLSFREKPLVSFQFNYLALRNKNLKVGIITTNLLGKLYINEISQHQNFWYTRQSMALPQAFLFKMAYYWNSTKKVLKN
jgi:hypothetical protein